MLKVVGTSITLTRGDTARLSLSLTYKDTGEWYIPAEGDTIRFAMKKDYDDSSGPILTIQIDPETLELHIRPEDTKQLAYGTYKYDIQLTTADGDVDTFIDRAELTLTEEVD